jgi:hypothetical protein
MKYIDLMQGEHNHIGYHFPGGSDHRSRVHHSAASQVTPAWSIYKVSYHHKIFRSSAITLFRQPHARQLAKSVAKIQTDTYLAHPALSI